MKDWIREILDRHGQTVTLETGEGASTAKAFLQPVTSRDEQVPEHVCGIGYLDGRLWMYLGQAEVCPGDGILCGGQRFRVRSSRAYHVGEDLLYWWASLEQEREAAE